VFIRCAEVETEALHTGPSSDVLERSANATSLGTLYIACSSSGILGSNHV